MEAEDTRAFVDLMIAEGKRRAASLPDDDETGAAYDNWSSNHLPSLNDLYLLYLVALRHHIERKLLYHAARVTRHGKPIKKITFIKRRRALLKMPLSKGRGEIGRRLNPSAAAHYASVEALKLLANCCKQDPRNEPDRKLIKHLKLNQN